jgi:predicted nucleotidyltransferase
MPDSASSFTPSGSATEHLAPKAGIDAITRTVLHDFKSILSEKYGQHLRALYLFGSRARGDHRPDSDLDIAVFLDAAPDPLGEQLDLIERG